VETARERVSRQEGRLQNARDVVIHNARRAKKLIEGVDEWRIFQVTVYNKYICEKNVRKHLFVSRGEHCVQQIHLRAKLMKIFVSRVLM
jgi:hypothetical protein